MRYIVKIQDKVFFRSGSKIIAKRQALKLTRNRLLGALAKLTINDLAHQIEVTDTNNGEILAVFDFSDQHKKSIQEEIKYNHF